VKTKDTDSEGDVLDWLSSRTPHVFAADWSRPAGLGAIHEQPEGVKAMPEQVELTGRQKFELAMLCDEVEEHGANLTAVFAKLIQFIAAEGITIEHFGKLDRSGDSLLHAVTATGIFRHPEDYEPHSLGHRALVAAGFAKPEEDESATNGGCSRTNPQRRGEPSKAR
jgi:hypothetical protein